MSRSKLQKFFTLALGWTMLGLSASSSAQESSCELGRVRWQRDWEAARQESMNSGKPVFVLFQEVPGCETCQTFGNQPMSHPLLVEAIEDLFVPVLVYNNMPQDESRLKSFNEPAWNNPVVRFLDSRLKDLIPRADRVWQTVPLAQRMVQSLQAAKRDVPVYLQAVAAEVPSESREQASFAMHCFWEGEAALGSLPGVQSTRSAFREGLEVVEVTFDPQALDYASLLKTAKELKCASTVFAYNDRQLKVAQKLVGEQAVPIASDRPVRSAKESDQRYYLANSRFRHLPLTELQSVRVNAELAPNRPNGEDAATKWLSPRQRKLLEQIVHANTEQQTALAKLNCIDHHHELVAMVDELQKIFAKQNE